MNFGHTDLRIGVSGSKFDTEADFEVRFAPAPPKLDKNLEKQMILVDFFFKFFENFPKASERIRVHPNASEQVQTGPSRSEQVQKLQKTCENFENFA